MNGIALLQEEVVSGRSLLTQGTYLAASVFFILGLRSLTIGY